jgi:hypothetical protein
MPAIRWAFLCDYAFVDAAGKASIIGMFENISARQIPAVHPQFYVMLELIASPNEEFRLGASINSPTGTSFGRQEERTIKASPEGGRIYTSFGFFAVKFQELGTFIIEILIDGTSVHTIPIQIKLIE